MNRFPFLQSCGASYPCLQPWLLCGAGHPQGLQARRVVLEAVGTEGEQSRGRVFLTGSPPSERSQLLVLFPSSGVSRQEAQGHGQGVW